MRSIWSKVQLKSRDPCAIAQLCYYSTHKQTAAEEERYPFPFPPPKNKKNLSPSSSSSSLRPIGGGGGGGGGGRRASCLPPNSSTSPPPPPPPSHPGKNPRAPTRRGEGEEKNRRARRVGGEGKAFNQQSNKNIARNVVPAFGLPLMFALLLIQHFLGNTSGECASSSSKKKAPRSPISKEEEEAPRKERE